MQKWDIFHSYVESIIKTGSSCALSGRGGILSSMNDEFIVNHIEHEAGVSGSQNGILLAQNSVSWWFYP